MKSDAPVFGIYEKALKSQRLSELFDAAASAGYDYLELSLDESDQRLSRLNWGHAEAQIVRRQANDSGLRLFSACFSGHRRYPLGSANPDIEAIAKEMLRKGIVLCERLGIRVLQVAGYDVFYEPRTKETGERYLANLAEGVEYAAQLGVMLAIEPVECFLDSVQKVMDVVHHIGSPWLQAYPDVSNLASLGMDPTAELSFGTGHIVAVHIRDSLPNFFYNVPLGTGIIDFPSVFQTLKSMDYAGPFLIEMWHQQGEDSPTVIRDAREFMLKNMEGSYV